MTDRPPSQRIARLLDFIGAIWVLMSLAIVSKFRLKGRYWTWRIATAFPRGTQPQGARALIRSGLEYARWAWRIRRLR